MGRVTIQSERKTEVKMAGLRFVEQTRANLGHGLLLLCLLSVTVAWVIGQQSGEFLAREAMRAMCEYSEVSSLPERFGRNARIQPVPREQATSGSVDLDGLPTILLGPSGHQANHRLADTLAPELMAAQGAEGQIDHNENAVIFLRWAEELPSRCTSLTCCGPWQPHKVAKNTVIVPSNNGTVAVAVLCLTQEALKLTAGNIGQPGTAVRFAPDDAGPRFERMCTSALIDDPGVVHELDGYGLTTYVDDDWFRHDLFLSLAQPV